MPSGRRLDAYENVGIGTVIASRQPFAAKARVKYEQIAQEYGDKLYEGKFDPRAAAAARRRAPRCGLLRPLLRHRRNRPPGSDAMTNRLPNHRLPA